MRQLFLDAASNTAMDKKVFKAMKPYLKKNFVGNSRSIHNYGIRASKAIEDSRKKIAQIMHTDINNVVFTCNALLESDNVRIYYSCADNCIGLAEMPLKDIVEACYADS